MVVLAVPFSPRTSTPPISGATVVRIRAVARSSDPTIAENGNARASLAIAAPSPFLRVSTPAATVGRSTRADVLTPRDPRVTVAGPLRAFTRLPFLPRLPPSPHPAP